MNLNAPTKPQPKYVYKAVRTTAFGIGAGDMPIFGVTLELHEGPDPELHPTWHPNWLAEELSMAGTDVVITLPEEGIIAGQFYELRMYDIGTDWETGYVDDYKLSLVHVEDV